MTIFFAGRRGFLLSKWFTQGLSFVLHKDIEIKLINTTLMNDVNFFNAIIKELNAFVYTFVSFVFNFEEGKKLFRTYEAVMPIVLAKRPNKYSCSSRCFHTSSLFYLF